jgi:hypothetical protein
LFLELELQGFEMLQDFSLKRDHMKLQSTRSEENKVNRKKRGSGISLLYQIKDKYELDFCLTVHHQLGKVIQKNQLDATMIYWSIRSVQHVSDNILPIIRSVRLRFFTAYGILLWWGGRRWAAAWHAAAHRLPAHHNNRIPYAVKNLSLTLLMMGKILPETCWACLIDQ